MDKIFIYIVIFCWITPGSSQHSMMKLEYPINLESLNEICPVVSFDERILFFTRVGDLACEKTLFIDSIDVSLTLTEEEYGKKLSTVYSQMAQNPIENPLNSSYNQDIWFTDLINDKAQGLHHPSYPINDVLPNSICSNYGKTNSFLVINQFAPHGGIDRGFSYTEWINGEFSFPKPIHIHRFNPKSAEVNVSASLDSSVIILAIDNTESLGDLDLFVCFRMGQNEYSEAINLGADINTTFRESTPMISHDGKKIFFTSDRLGGYGGKDIYFSERMDFTFTKWSSPTLLNPLVNSTFDDSHPHVMSDNNTLYFTSNRDGSSDIFKAKLIREKLKNELKVIINIINHETGEKSAGELIWGNAYTTERNGYFRSRDGLCSYKFFENKPIAFKAVNRNLKSAEIIIDPQDMINSGQKSMEINLIMYSDGRVATVDLPKPDLDETSKISESEINKIILLNNIYFERAKAAILPESTPAIEKLAQVLKSRPRLYVSIIGHTDNVGDKVALKELSQDRAMAIKKLLVEQGVPDFRVETQGFGDARPIAPNDSEANKSKNRRVEIKILSQ